jgi:hypothetical protein
MSEKVHPYSDLLERMEKQEAIKHGRNLAEKHITGRRKPKEMPIGKLIPVDFRNEQDV